MQRVCVSVLVVLVVSQLCVISCADIQEAWTFNIAEADQWMEKMKFPTLSSSSSPSGIFQQLLKVGFSWGKSMLETFGVEFDTNVEPYPYFHWIPPYVTSVVPSQEASSWTAPCFNQTTAAVTIGNNGIASLVFEFSGGPSSVGCSDFYLIGTLSQLTFVLTEASGSQTVHFNTANLTASELWDIKNNGIRIFRFLDDVVQTIENLVDTILLFVPEATVGVSQSAAERNIDFLAKYAGRVMTKRSTPTVSIPESSVNSGDFFGVIRLDGLDPMLAWAMGSTTGHTTVALRDPTDGQLYITESTAKDSYWPVNGIQRTPFQQWLGLARKAGYQVVHAPLSPANQQIFNETAAWAKFYELQGLDYGYYNMLYGWIDTLNGNYPCLPPDYTQCLEWPHVEVLFGIISRLIPFGDRLFLQAFNLRLGTTGLDWPTIVMTAAQQGLQMDNLPYVVEQDSWQYETTRYNVSTVGPSMVCCVYVCNVWKAAGLFGDLTDEINCAEQTNFDIYSMNIFDSNAVRPPQCVKADPNNQLCQLEGQYTLNLNGYNTRPLYAHEDESCPSLPPAYQRPTNC